MRVLILYNIARQLRKGTAAELSCEAEIEIIAPIVRDILVRSGHVVDMLETTFELWEELKRRRTWYDIAFNLAEAFGGTNSHEPLVPSMLEALNIPFTGASSHNMMLTTDKIATKRTAQALGITTPRYAVAYSAVPPSRDLRFPLIVKPAREEASIGVTLDSIVHDELALLRQVAQASLHYRQPVLIEEFIKGQEISVGIIGNASKTRVLPALEFIFEDAQNEYQKIRSYEYKWGGRRETMVPASLDADLQQTLNNWALGLYEACECRDYARMDFRVGPTGAHLLEVNCNPGIGPNTHGLNNTLTMMASFDGQSFEALLLEVLETGAARERIALANASAHD
jgi:D-alanine-D-alanine ligase